MQLKDKIVVTGVSVEHIPKSLAPNSTTIDSAPRDFSVYVSIIFVSLCFEHNFQISIADVRMYIFVMALNGVHRGCRLLKTARVLPWVVSIMTLMELQSSSLK